MTLYLQKEYKGGYSISEKNNHKDNIFDFDFYTLESGINENTTYTQLIEYIKEKYPTCKKLVLDF